MADDEKKGGATDEDLERIKDTNVEGIGSKENRDLRKKAAKTEKAWQGAGSEPGIQVWRIEKFKVKKWPKRRYGEFYDGDSYIILHTMKVQDKLAYDVYFWLGAETSQDEAGTAAYKTVELDDLLGDLPVQYREVHGNESQRFLGLWDKIHILNGGVESGFNKAQAKEYQPRLLHVTGHKKNVQVYQVPLKVQSLTTQDSFVLDTGLVIYLFHGDKASNWEKRTASFEVEDIKNSRHGKVEQVHVIDGIDEKNEDADSFWELLGGKPESLPDEVKKEEEEKVTLLRMLQVSDESGDMKVSTVSEGYVDLEKLDSKDAFICDFGLTVYIWIGNGANKAEKQKAMMHVVQYLENEKRSTKIPICRVLEGKEPDHFFTLMKEGKTHGWDAQMMTAGFIGRRDSLGVYKEV